MDAVMRRDFLDRSLTLDRFHGNLRLQICAVLLALSFHLPPFEAAILHLSGLSEFWGVAQSTQISHAPFQAADYANYADANVRFMRQYADLDPRNSRNSRLVSFSSDRSGCESMRNAG